MKYSKITISGRICTGKSTLFWGLQERLNWPVFSTGQFFRDFARIHNLDLEKAEEQSINLTVKTDLRTKALLKTYDHVIVEGWMAGVMADKIPGVFKILLIANDKKRIERFARREKISPKEAEKRLKSREESWLKKLQKIYPGINIFDPGHYDLVIDTTHQTTPQILKIALNKLSS